MPRTPHRARAGSSAALRAPLSTPCYHTPLPPVALHSPLPAHLPSLPPLQAAELAAEETSLRRREARREADRAAPSSKSRCLPSRPADAAFVDDAMRAVTEWVQVAEPPLAPFPTPHLRHLNGPPHAPDPLSIPNDERALSFPTVERALDRRATRATRAKRSNQALSQAARAKPPQPAATKHPADALSRHNANTQRRNPETKPRDETQR